jgi:hypothetical protein
MYANVGDFKVLYKSSREDGIFVDKTLMIQEIIDSKNVPLLITRPRRWGKTLNMSMLYYFFVDRNILRNLVKTVETGKTEQYIKECDEMFENLNILNPKINPKADEARKHLGKYPCIFLSFPLLEMNYGVSLKEKIIGKIANTFIEFMYISKDLEMKIKKFNWENLKEYTTNFQNLANEDPTRIGKIHLHGDEILSNLEDKINNQKFIRICNKKLEGDDFEDCLNFLAKLLENYHKNPAFIFIDEYDGLINKFFNDKEIFDELMTTFSGIFSSLIKLDESSKNHIHKVVFTGILRVAKANLFSSLNNLDECSVFENKFSQYYGFTQKEVIDLLETAHMTKHKKEVMDWYNGYKIGEDTIYNPWSMVQFLKNRKIDNYWIQTANNNIIEDIIMNNRQHSINKDLRKIILEFDIENKKSFEITVNKYDLTDGRDDPESIWSFLIHSGYLTIELAKIQKDSKFTCNVRIPNREVFGIYSIIVNKWLNSNSIITGVVTSVFTKDYPSLVNNLVYILKKSYDSPLFPRQENSLEIVYHYLLLSEINKEIKGDRYSILPNEGTGYGYADILFIDNLEKKLVVIKLKRASDKNELKNKANEALDQIFKMKNGEDSNYSTFEKLPALGISLCGTSVVMKVQGIESMYERVSNKRNYSEAFSENYSRNNYGEDENEFKYKSEYLKKRAKLENPREISSYNMKNMFSFNKFESFNTNLEKNIINDITNSLAKWADSVKYGKQEQISNDKNRLIKEATRFGYEINDQPPDGNSLFRSITLQLNKNRFSGNGYEIIRAQTFKEICNNKEIYEAKEGEINMIIKYNLKSECWEDFFKYFPQAISRTFNLHVIIIGSDDADPIIYRRPQIREQLEPKTVYIGHESNWFYYSLKPIEDKNAEQSRKLLRELLDATEIDKYIDDIDFSKKIKPNK